MTLQLQIALVQHQHPTGSAATLLPEMLDERGACLQFICEELAVREFLEFRVSGFGDAAWPVDVRTDLCVVMEQMGDVLERLKLGISCSLDFYEQGVERRISFVPQMDTLVAECISGLIWGPSPSTVVIGKQDFIRMLEEFVTDFLHYTQLLGSELLADRARSFLERSA